MRCFRSAAEYHAYWRVHPYRRVIHAGFWVACSTVTAAVVGGGPVLLMRHFSPPPAPYEYHSGNNQQPQMRMDSP